MVSKTQIKNKIILNKKDIRLDDFLSNALFGKNGYYKNKIPIGKRNDFVTAPEISQMFGEIIGLYLYYIWSTKINSKYNLIELGPGKGTLFNDIFRSVLKYPNFQISAKIQFIEINKQLEKIQKKNFAKLKLENPKWNKTIDYKSKFPSIIYSNEFFDCFPVRQFLLKDKWFERYVSYNKNENNYFIKEKLVNNSKILSILNSYNKEKILEISFERNKYFEKICKFIKKNGGLVFTIDYGYFENNKNFTLQAIQNHKKIHIFDNIGAKDISSHVDFKHFIKIAYKYNLNIDECCSQREFLIKYGILERSKLLNLSKNSKDLERLINVKEMGSLFKCLIVSNL